VEHSSSNSDLAFLRFKTICSKNGVELDDEKVEKLREYVTGLLNWNTRINLISRNDISNVWLSHILHSLSVLFIVDIMPNRRILDLGTGGGLPGIPLAIARPDLIITLLDSVKKKTDAVQSIVNQVVLGNIEVVTGRAEEMIPQLGRRFDVVVSRAVAPLVDLIKWSKPLLKVNPDSKPSAKNSQRITISDSCLLSLKGGDLEKEIDTAKLKTNVKNIVTKNIMFSRSDEIGIEDKKLVIVHI
jgi:16S rRNA (guanine527-N7)-methyltransferase